MRCIPVSSEFLVSNRKEADTQLPRLDLATVKPVIKSLLLVGVGDGLEGLGLQVQEWVNLDL